MNEEILKSHTVSAWALAGEEHYLLRSLRLVVPKDPGLSAHYHPITWTRTKYFGFWTCVTASWYTVDL
jgi:hypothetical protein